MAFGGVATGNINAKDADTVQGHHEIQWIDAYTLS